MLRSTVYSTASGRSNKSVSYRRGKAPRPTLGILIFKTPLVCTSIAGDRSSFVLRREKFGGESATAWCKTPTIWRESNDRVTNGDKITIETEEWAKFIMKFVFNPTHRVAHEPGNSLRQTIYFAVSFIRTICRYFYFDGFIWLLFFFSITASV